MQVWKRRVAFLVSAVGGVGLLMSSAEAREPRDRRESPPPTLPVDFTFPSIPPPPTMPPPTSPPSTSPPPTMPPITSPPSSVPATDNFIEDLITRLEELAENSHFEELQQIVDEIIADFID